MPSIGMVGFMVGDDIHLVMWESVGDVIIAGITQGGCIVVFAILVLCHTNRELFCLGHYQLLMHTCPHLAKECILPPLLAVPCDILENIPQVPLSGPGIKVLSMTKEEQHKRKMEQLMEFLQLPLVALLSRAVRNDLRHQFAKRKEQIIGITGR
jgi:hypothetical protein